MNTTPMYTKLDNIYGLYESATRFLHPIDLIETYSTIAKEVLRVTGGDFSSILLKEKSKIVVVYSTNPLLAQIRPRKKGYTYGVFKTGKPRILKGKDLRNIHSEFSETKIKSDLIVPLKNRGKSIGVLAVTSEKKEFSKKDMANLQVIASLAMLAIRKAQLYKDLNKEIETRDLFISIASHELKTPITTVSTYVQLIKRKLSKGEKLDTDWVEHILDEMARLTKLIDELLQMDRIKSGRLEYNFEPSSIKEIVKHAILSFKANHPESEVIFNDNLLEQNDAVIADFDKLIEVIINLLDNASKYSPDEKDIIVDLKCNDNTVVISVKDKGRGIPKKDLPKVFNSFYKGEDNTVEGMGLGLYLSKQIIDKHKGKIEIKSKLNEGTNIRISLPLFDYERNR